MAPRETGWKEGRHMNKAILLHKDQALKRSILGEYFDLLELLGVRTFIEEPILALDLSKNLLL